MSKVRAAGIAGLAALLAACSTVESRIADHRKTFDALPPEIQRKIRAGQVDVGFTRAQAAIALGRPDRIYTRKTAGTQREIWVYGETESGPFVGLGYGMGMGAGFYSIGIAAAPPPAYGARLRVTLEGDKVVAVEGRKTSEEVGAR